MKAHLRIARPVRDLETTAMMYQRGLGLQVLGRFVDHAGFDGVMLGRREMDYHFEFTRRRESPLAPSPTAEDLAVFYLPDVGQWQEACRSMLIAGFVRERAVNPYWDERGATFVDADGYRVVLQNAERRPAVEEMG